MHDNVQCIVYFIYFQETKRHNVDLDVKNLILSGKVFLILKYISSKILGYIGY